MKFICGNESQNSAYLWIYTGKGHKRTLWGDGNVYILDLGGDYTDIHIG